MKGLISYFIKYPISANLLMLVIFVFGIAGFSSLRSTFFPETQSRIVSVQVISPGASPKEVEKNVTKKIETKLESISGVKNVTSNSSENLSFLTVEMDRGVDMYLALQDVNNAVNQISFKNVEDIFVFKQEMVMPTISFSVSTESSLEYLKKKVDIIEDDLKSVDGISEISIQGLPEPEIEVSINEDNLSKYNITIEEISNAIATKNLDISLGKIESNENEYLLRYNNQSTSVDGIENIVLRTDPTGFKLKLKDVADVSKEWSEISTYCYEDGGSKLSATVTISNTNSQDIVFIADYAKDYIDKINEDESNINATLLFDASNPLKQRLELLTKNALIGFFLVLIFMTMFLNVRVSFWVALSIPISFLGMFFLAPFAGITINMMTMYAMILVIGILVDDGIIISESIIKKYEDGYNNFNAAVRGTMEVFPAVFAGVSTTAVAFSSFFFFDGMMGEFGWQMGFVVIATLIFSLVEGAFILPAHIAHSRALNKKNNNKWSIGSFFNKVAYFFNKILNFFRDKYYLPFYKFCVRNTTIVFFSFVFIVGICFWGVSTGFVKSTFFPSIELDELYIEFSVEPGKTKEVTKLYAEKIDNAVQKVNLNLQDSLGHDVIRKTHIEVGPSPHKGFVNVFTYDPDIRQMSPYEIVNEIRKELNDIDGLDKLIIGVRDPFGRPASFSLLSNDYDALILASREFATKLQNIKDISSAVTNHEYGVKEVHFSLSDKAKNLGLNPSQILLQIRQAYFGLDVQTLQTKYGEEKLWIRLNKKTQNSFSELEKLKIKTISGEIELKELVDYNLVDKELSIKRKNGKNIITIDGELASKDSNISEILSIVNEEIIPYVESKYPVTVELAGSSDEGTKTIESMQMIGPVFTIFILCIVLITFRSFLQTFTVFLLIPFTFIGVVFGHLIHGMPISVLSGFGVVALLGVLVNDGLVFISGFNINIKEGDDFNVALEKTALSRFRPILLTTMTTVFGLLPLIFETSMQAQFLIPMAISLSYGIIIATLLTLILLPALIVGISNFRILLFAYSKIIFPKSEPSTFTKSVVFFPVTFLIPFFLLTTMLGYINKKFSLFHWILKDINIYNRNDFEPRIREKNRLKEMI